MSGVTGRSGRWGAGLGGGLGLLVAGALSLAAGPLLAQAGIERPEGLRDNTPRWHALTGARLVLAPGQVVEAGTVVLRDGIVVAAGAGVAVPEGARVWALAGRTVYPGFIDLAGSVGVPGALRAPPPQRPGLPADEEVPARKARPEPKPMGMRALASRNPSVRPEQDVALQLEWNAAEAKLARELGFTAVLATPSAGVFRGQGALVSTGDRGDVRAAVLRPGAAQHLAFEVGRGPDAGYPSSLMGAIALVRQTLLDARWHRAASARPASGERLAPNASLAALAPVLEGRQPVVLAAEDEQDYARLARLRDEFGLRAVLHGTGHEYRRAAQIRATSLPVVVPLDFPPPPDVANPDAALDVPLASLQHWEQAPSNLALLHRAGVLVAVTAAGLRDARRDFWPRLRQAVRRGLPAEQALAALTTVPAGLLGERARLGTIAPGRIANLVVARGDLFSSEEATIELVFVDGRPLPTEALETPDPRGTWAVDGGGETLRLVGSASQPRLEREGDSCEMLRRGRAWVLRLSCAKGVAPSAEDTVVVAELRDDVWMGTLQRGTGPLQPWSAKRLVPASGIAPAADRPVAPAAAASAAPASATAAAADRAVPVPWPSYPAGAFGITVPERPAAVLVRNATLWTQGPEGRLSGADLLVREGRIAAVGVGLAAPAGARVIDATGKHVTPGLIDAHSHIAITRGVNEGTHSVTAEVRIGDVLDPTDINLYRQLAGGLTAANLMHGSANTIGGQTQVIKLRWGGTAEDLVFEGARPGIKFALGENVKRSNWGDPNRYPATRMGVEQLLRDSFQAAREYDAEWSEWRAAPRGRPEPRRDLQLETLVQVLQRQRAVHIHSYRADEILMFARLAREFGIDVAAFQHVLEGYKVADAMASIGAGGSTFSDWWGYKMEVVDAVPANGALMHRAGVLTSFNSDDPEMARRMNTEAAKAVKYGGLSETEALALVTLNPARQLGVDRQTGSLEPGKDADFVIWSASPLSTYARAEQTWIDGRRYFDLEDDRRLREAAAAERSRLVTAALRAPRPVAAAAGRTEPQRPSLAQALLDGRSWREVLDAARSHRHAYSGQAAWHECTEDQP